MGRSRSTWTRSLSLLSLSLLMVLWGVGHLHAQDQGKDRKMLFSENFELDIYAWEITQKGRVKAETPKLFRTETAFGGKQCLKLEGQEGLLELKLTAAMKGLVELWVKFSAPYDYRRMLAVDDGKTAVMMGVNQSGVFSYVVGTTWVATDKTITEGWHKFLWDYSGTSGKISIDDDIIGTFDKPQYFNHITLGINQGKGGTCYVDDVVVYSTDPKLTQENTFAVTLPLTGWDQGLKTASASNDVWATASYSISDDISHSGEKAAKISYQATGNKAEKYRRYHFRFRRPQALPGLPQKLSLWIHGDGNVSYLDLLFASYNSLPTYKAGKIDWVGWRKVTINLAIESKSIYGEKGSARGVGGSGSYFRGFDLNAPSDKAGAVYVDDLELTTLLSRKKPYVLAVESVADDNIHSLADDLRFKARVYNYSESEKHFTVGCLIKDYWGNVITRKDEDVVIGKHQDVVVAITTTGTFQGYMEGEFFLSADGDSVAMAKESVCVLAPLGPQALTAANPLGLYGMAVPSSLKIGLKWGHAGGDGILRPYLKETWNPETPAHEQGFEYGIVKPHSQHSWAPDKEFHEKERKVAEKMGAAIAGIAGRVTNYWTGDEPNNHGITPARHVALQRYLYPAVKKADPDYQVVAPCTAGFDLPYIEGIFKEGGLDYLDVVAVNAFARPRSGGYKPEESKCLEKMIKLDELVKKYNKGESKPLWASAISHFTDRITERQQADYTAREVIEFMTVDNFKRMYYFLPRDSYPTIFLPGIYRFDGTPKPLAVAFHTLAETIIGVRYVSTLDLGEGIRAYVFQKKDVQILSLWSVEAEEVVVLDLAADRVTTIDFMGVTQVLKPKNGTLRLSLNESPLFLQSLPGDNLFAHTLQCHPRVFELEPGQEREVWITIGNGTKEELAGTLQWTVPESFEIRPKGRPDDQPITMKPAETKRYSFTLSVPGDARQGEYSLRAVLTAGGTSVDYLNTSTMTLNVVKPLDKIEGKRFRTAPDIDGSLDENAWHKEAAIVDNFVTNQGYIPKHKTQVHIGYDDRNLYIGVNAEKTGKLVLERTERDDGTLWQDECLEIFVDTNLDRKSYYHLIVNASGVQTDYRYTGVGRNEKERDGFRKWNGEWMVATAIKETHWVAELAIPWKTLGLAAGKHALGINVGRENRDEATTDFSTIARGGFHSPAFFIEMQVDLKE